MVTKSMRRVFLGLTLLSFVSLFGSGVYYLSFVTQGSLALITIFATLATLLVARLVPIEELEKEPIFARGTPAVSGALLLGGLLSLGVFLWRALESPITSATRSLWLLFSPGHILFLAAACIATLLLYHTSPRLSAFLGGLTASTTASLAALLFPLGFGFDPFLHRATLEHIALHGTITPKPFYYIGTYILELWGHLLFALPLFFVDVLLAPLGIGLVTWIALRSKSFHPAALALLPFAAFISTTPQAMSFLWVALLVLALCNKLPRVYLWIFALAAFAAHPLAGVPALMLVTLFTAQQAFRKSPLPLAVLTILGIFGIPLMFFAQQLITGTDVGFSWFTLTDFSRIPSLGFFDLRGTALLDSIMLFGGNLFFITLFLAMIGFFTQRNTQRAYRVPLVLSAIIAMGNFFILSLGFNFPFLISYERTDFALRLITLAWIFLLPLASEGIRFIIEQIAHKKKGTTANRLVQAYGIVFVTLLFSANVYVSFPRHDGYSRSAAFNATPADQEIVHRIADDAKDEEYIVLSNQTLASMAVQEFGFFQYYHGSIFAYPIPTSSPTYTLFLEMIEGAPNLGAVEEAKHLTGASRVYFVVHDYWWEADDRIAEAKKITDHWFTSDDGTITVFAF